MWSSEEDLKIFCQELSHRDLVSGASFTDSLRSGDTLTPSSSMKGVPLRIDESTTHSSTRQSDQIVVPPLDLPSCDSSVNGSDDLLKGSLDIDLRCVPESERLKTGLLKPPSQPPPSNSSGRSRLNGGSDEIKQDNSKSEAPFKNYAAICSSRSGVIFIGDEVIGRYLKPSGTTKIRRNFIEGNKTTYWTQRSTNSYDLMFKNKRNPSCSPNEIPTDYSKHQYTSGNAPLSFPALHCGSSTGRDRFYEHQKPSSSVLQKGLMQQMKLIAAYNDYFARRHTGRLTRLSHVCHSSKPLSKLSIFRSKSVHPHIQYSNYALSSERLNMPVRAQRYTAKEYALLPLIQSRPGHLGPDLKSDEYKSKLARYQRQQAYANILRMHVLRQQERKLFVSGRCKDIQNEMSPLTAQEFHTYNSVTSSSVSHNTRLSANSDALMKDTAGSNIAEFHTNASATTPETISSTEKPVNNKCFWKENHLKMSKFTIHSEVAMSEKQMLESDAARRRDAMLCYAKQVRKLLQMRQIMHKSSKKNIPAHPSFQSNEVLSFTGEFADMTLQTNTDRRVDELLRRHEEDCRQVEAIRKSLKLSV